MKGAWHGQFKRKPAEARTLDGVLFPTVLEMNVWRSLVLMQEAGEIKNLVRQVRHLLVLPDGTPILLPSGRTAYYTTDFEWDDCVTGKHIYGEAKGYLDRNAQFRIAVFQAIKKCTVMMIRK